MNYRPVLGAGKVWTGKVWIRKSPHLLWYAGFLRGGWPRATDNLQGRSSRPPVAAGSGSDCEDIVDAEDDVLIPIDGYA
jgi:hypothetical protein